MSGGKRWRRDGKAAQTLKGSIKMTNTFRLTTLAAFALSIPAYAMGAGVAEVDSNGDGILSVAEVQAVYPDITAEQFAAMDLNADGALDDGEVQAAQEAGVMPAASEG
jgi:hypothetical protein